jgi:hypothetical protein
MLQSGETPTFFPPIVPERKDCMCVSVCEVQRSCVLEGGGGSGVKENYRDV